MKKSFTKQHFTKLVFGLLFIVLGCFNKATAQGQYNNTTWKFSNPKQFGFTVFDIDYLDNNNVLAVGADGGIAKSTDGGRNWTYGVFTYTTPAGLVTKATLFDVHYVSANIAYVVGTGGCMAKTVDGGATWNLVKTPLYDRGRNINTTWFLNENKGYIGGQHNTPDSLPKLYFTLNGGATWDSINAPTGGKTAIGYINNPNLPRINETVTAKDKEILRIEFANDSTGYIVGTGTSLFPRLTSANATTCLPNTTTTSTGSQNASLVWKFSSGQLTDYSLSKERLGYTGINTNTVTCTTLYGNITPQTQSYRAMNIINDSTIVIMSANNNIVVKIRAGKNDSTAIANYPGTFERGKYELLNFPFPPTAGPNAGTPIPATQVLLASNPYMIKRAANGKLFATSGSSAFAPTNRMWTSIDTGRNWIEERNLPTGFSFSQGTVYAIDFAPNGRFLGAGINGVIADSLPGGSYSTLYKAIPLVATHTDAEFADCNNGMLTGGASISVTEDGGKNWLDKSRPDFAASNYSIGGVAYPNINKSYFAVSNGVVYVSTDKGTTLDPAYSNFNFQMFDVDAVGNDSVWVVANTQFTVPTTSTTSNVFRSINGGATWQVYAGFPVGSTAPRLSKISFGSRLVGFAVGSRNAVYRTLDGGVTWTSVNPFPALNEGPTGFPNAFINYTEVEALDANTVFVVGNMFTNVGIKRIYKSTDAGTTWTDISGNISTIFPVGNVIGLRMHDANNGYVTCGSSLFKTTNGGATWEMDIAPTNSLFETMAFAPKRVPAAIPFANRKLFVSGFAAPTANGSIMEYGNPANINVNATETVTNATCTNPNGGSITLNTTGGLAPYTYSIDGVNFQTSNTFNGLTQGVKTITIKDAFCGIQTKQITVGFTDNLTLSVAPTSTAVCANIPVQLTATSAATTYSWSPAIGLSNANISNPTATISNSQNYAVTATLNGCVKTQTVAISIKPKPIALAGNDQTIVEGGSVQLLGNVIPSNLSPIANYVWSPSNGLSDVNTLSPIASPKTTTVYTLTVNGVDGCVGADDVTVTVLPNCIKVMKAFTPNGDGINDKWIVTTGNTCTKQVIVNVFNRYGSSVYSNQNYQNDWNGTYQSKPVADGTYYYVIEYKLIDGRTQFAKGDVTILR
ncbi:YCF48-related protein [Ferruginibacter yonginensis]|uniref:YCF48-related protein n=1 Tax=Ferruginibacter yonginensis TaxID=1310416 RepID=A0ABV8QVL3_9BACT